MQLRGDESSDCSHNGGTMIRISIYLILALIAAGACTVSSGPSVVGGTHVPEIGSVDSTVKSYINLALEGDQNGVLEVSATTPPSYIEICKNEAARQKNPDAPVSDGRVAIDLHGKHDTKYEITESENPFSKLIRTGGSRSSSFIEAEKLFELRADFQEFRVIERRIRNNEAIADVEYQYKNAGIMKTRYYLFHSEDGWRVFDFDWGVSKEFNPNYAKERPPCPK